MVNSAARRSYRKLVIAIDVSCLATVHKTGVSYYTFNLLQGLAKLDDVSIVAYYPNFLGRNHYDLPLSTNIRYRQGRLVPKQLLNLLRRYGVWLPFEFMTKVRADFHLFPAFVGWPSLLKTPSAAVLHDFVFLDMPEVVSARNQHDLTRLVPQTLRRSTFAIVTSKVNESLLRKHYSWYQKPVVITPIPPTSDAKQPADESRHTLRKLGVEGPFFLFLGTLEPRKNIQQLLEAYDLFVSKHGSSYALVLAGGKGWNDDEIVASIQRLQDRGLRVLSIGYVNEDQRSALYQNAAAFVLVSLYEGFGMPILEALSYGLPAVVSDIPIFHEVADQAAIFVNPRDSRAIARGFDMALATGTKKRLAGAGFKRANKYTWASTTGVVYDKISMAVREAE